MTAGTSTPYCVGGRTLLNATSVAYQTTRRRGSYLASSSRQRRTTLTAAVGAAATETAGTSADDAKDLSQHIFVDTESNNTSANNGQDLWLEDTLSCYPTAQLYSQLNHRNSVYLHTLIHFSSCICLYASAPASAFGVSAHAQDHVFTENTLHNQSEMAIYSA